MVPGTDHLLNACSHWRSILIAGEVESCGWCCTFRMFRIEMSRTWYAHCSCRAKAHSDHATSSSWEITVQRTAQHVSFDSSSNSTSRADASSSSNVVHLGVLLGAGSFGRVYKGRWRGRDVAVKVIRHSSKTADVVLNEVNLMLSLEHPNIVRALHVINWHHKQPQDPRASAERASSSLYQGTTSSPQGSDPAGLQVSHGGLRRDLNCGL